MRSKSFQLYREHESLFWSPHLNKCGRPKFKSIFFLQGGLSGVAAKFPPEYMGAVVQGQGLGGIFAASVNVVTLALPGADFESAAFYCFLVTILFLALALVALAALMRTEFFLVRIQKLHFSAAPICFSFFGKRGRKFYSNWLGTGPHFYVKQKSGGG